MRWHDFGVTAMALSSDGKWIASGSIDKTVRLWDATTLAPTPYLRGLWEAKSQSTVAFGPDGRWDVTYSMVREGVGISTPVAASRDGRWIVAGYEDGGVRVWDASIAEHVVCSRGHSPVQEVVVAPDNRCVASGYRGYHGVPDGTIRLWDLVSRRELACLSGHKDAVAALAFSCDSRRLLSGSHDRTVRVWDGETGFELLCLRGHEDWVHCVTYSHDDCEIVSGSRDKTVRVWDGRRGAELAVLRGHEDAVLSVACSPDGKRIASGAYDKTVRIWDACSGKEVACLKGHSGGVGDVVFSPDGLRIASRSWESVRVWDARNGNCLEVVQGSGDVRAIAAGSQAFPLRALARAVETVVEQADTGKPVAWFPAYLRSIVTHPSGRTWAGAAGNYLCLISLEGGDLRSLLAISCG